jgi:hypothetical protein
MKSKFLFAIETNPNGKKTIDLFGKSRLILNKSDAKFMASLLIHSKQYLSSCSIGLSLSDRSCSAKSGVLVLSPPVLQGGVPKAEK